MSVSATKLYVYRNQTRDVWGLYRHTNSSCRDQIAVGWKTVQSYLGMAFTICVFVINWLAEGKNYSKFHDKHSFIMWLPTSC